MARYECKCGKLLWNGQTPNDIELVVYTDKEWSDIIEKDNIISWMIPDPRYDVWMCPKCKRIYVFDGNKVVRQYVANKGELQLIDTEPLGVLNLSRKRN